MAVPARFESPLATRTPHAANDGYGSLMGMGAPRKKKKPVLVLDADEIAKAHLAIAAGGAQIMEEVADPDYAARPRAPVAFFGLAPMGADDADAEDAAAYPPIPDASSWESEEQSQPEQILEDYTNGGELKEAVERDPPANNLEQLSHRSAARRDEEEESRASVIPSIEKQLMRMRALPTAFTDKAVPAEEAASPLRLGPMERLNQMGFSPDGLGLSASHRDDRGHLPAGPAGPDEVFELDIEAEPEAELALEPEPKFAPEPLQQVPSQVEPVQPSADLEDEPDYSWLHPEERRELQIVSGKSSALRERLVHGDNAAADCDQQASLRQRLMRWIAGLFRR